MHLLTEPAPGAAAAAQDEGRTEVMISVVPPAGRQRMPADICCVIDVSDSMAAEATMQGELGVTVSHGLSVLDVVKHAMRTISENLGPSDRLSLVVFGSDAQMLFNLTPMDDAGKRIAEHHLTALVTGGSVNGSQTYLFAGLKMGIDVLEAGCDTPGRLRHLMLLTDGVPTREPPRGTLPMVKKFLEREATVSRCGGPPCTINTFGFGFELDSNLLSELAIMGNGMYAYIPDAGLVGTVFVNAMTNLLVTMATNVRLNLKLCEGGTFPSDPVLGSYAAKVNKDGSLVINLSSLQFGQRKDVIVQVNLPTSDAGQEFLEATLDYSTRASSSNHIRRVAIKGMEPGADFEMEPQRCRLMFVDGVRQAMKMMKQTSMEKMNGAPPPLPAVQQYVRELADKLAASEAAGLDAMQALDEDLSGQVAESFSRQDWYDKWGIHYLPSLMCAHLSQQCNNFKDAGVQHYGGDLFDELRDIADSIFCGLPPPTPSPRPPPPAPHPTASAAPSRAAVSASRAP